MLITTKVYKYVCLSGHSFELYIGLSLPFYQAYGTHQPYDYGQEFKFFFEKAELYLSIYQDINPCFSNNSLLIIRGSS